MKDFVREQNEGAITESLSDNKDEYAVKEFEKQRKEPDHPCSTSSVKPGKVSKLLVLYFHLYEL